MHVRHRRIAAWVAAGCWAGVTAFCIAGIVTGSGLTPNMNRFFNVILILAAVLSLAVFVDRIITPLVAGHGIGVRAAMRAGRDGSPAGKKGRHAAPVKEGDGGTVTYLEARR